MAGSNVYSAVGNLTPDRNMFNLSESVSFDARFGDLIPLKAWMCVPGDVFKISVESVIRMQPSFVPFNHEIDVKFYFFFVPFRLLDRRSEQGRFESVISGGLRGNESRDFYRLSELGVSTIDDITARHGIGDYLGITPVPCTFMNFLSGYYTQKILAYPWFAYNKIYIDYFADENLETEKFEDSSGFYDAGDSWIHSNYKMQLGNWSKDYFTSSLPFQQRGTPPALPLSGTLDVVGSDVFTGSFHTYMTGSNNYVAPNQAWKFSNSEYSGVASDISVGAYIVGQELDPSGGGVPGTDSNRMITPQTEVKAENGNFTVDLGDAITFDVTDLRYAFQVQKFMERNARAGVRYTEFLKSHFGVSPSDSRLDRSEYLGGSTGHIVVSEVLQTVNATDGELGQYAGHGLSAFADNAVDNYRVEEFGTIMCFMLIKPKAGYMQGIPREWTWGDRFEWYFPEFAHLSEQAIRNSEIFVNVDDQEDLLDDIFGYQGIYDELRSSYDRVAGDMRDSLDYWHLVRKFSTRPELSEEFIKISPTRDDLNRVFNYEGTTENAAYPFLCKVGFNVSALRPLPFIPEPGLIDHF